MQSESSLSSTFKDSAAEPDLPRLDSEQTSLEIPDTAIFASSFAFDEVSDKLFFRDKKENIVIELSLSPTTHKMFSTIIQKQGKPTTNLDLEEALYDTQSGERAVNNRIRSNYDKLKRDLEKQVGDRVSHLYHDLQGYRILPFRAPVTLEKVRANTNKLLAYGPWSYDRRTEVLFYEDQLVTLRPASYEAITEALKNLPKPIGTNTIPRLLEVAKELNGNLQRIHPDATRIFCRCRGLEDGETDTKQYVLDVSPYELDQTMLEKMQIIEFGDVMVSPLQGRIWVDGEPVEVYQKEWQAYSAVLEGQITTDPSQTDKFVSSASIAQRYGSSVNAVIDQLDKLRGNMNKVSEGSGDTHIRAANQYGYTLCFNEEDFITKLAAAQSLRSRGKAFQKLFARHEI
jgi:DNA-binding response OmpR family regulator